MNTKKEIKIDIMVDLIEYISNKIVDNCDKLSELDGKIGDSDHGENMKRGFRNVIKNKEKLKKKNTVKELFNEIGDIITFNVGGSAGPLFGRLFSDFGNSCEEHKYFTIEMLPSAMNSALNGVKDLGGAEVGDKTMVDTIAPVVDFLNEVNLSELECDIFLIKLKEEARKGLESTKLISARKGRARYLNERSIGHMDPGAYSCYLFFEAIEKYFNDNTEGVLS